MFSSVSALHRTVCNGNTKKIRKLLVAGAAVNEKEETNGVTALHLACLAGNVGAAGVLLEFGADMSLLSHGGRTCLHATVENGGRKIVQFLLQHGGTGIINTTDVDGLTALHVACNLGKADLVRLLLEAGADLESPDKLGSRPLHWGTRSGEPGVVRQLLEWGGVEVDSCNEQGRTPLYCASIMRHLGIVRLLINANADVNKADKEQMCPLYVATQRGFVEVVKELLAAGAQVDQCTDKQATALHMSSALGHLDVVKELLLAGADVLKPDVDGLSALFYSVKDGRTDIPNVLLEAGADVNQAGKGGETPLMRCRTVPIVRLLLDAGAIPNATDALGSNALHYAGYFGRPAALICSLFKGGCDPGAIDDFNQTPADVARKAGHEDAAALLERLAEDARKKSHKADVAPSNSVSSKEAKDDGETDASKLNAEQEVETLVAGIEDLSVGVSRHSDKAVKPCAHCGGITHRRCAGCRVTHYRSRDCQCAAYAEHKGMCVALRVERREAKAQRAIDRAELNLKIASAEA